METIKQQNWPKVAAIAAGTVLSAYILYKLLTGNGNKVRYNSRGFTQVIDQNSQSKIQEAHDFVVQHIRDSFGERQLEVVNGKLNR